MINNDLSRNSRNKERAELSLLINYHIKEQAERGHGAYSLKVVGQKSSFQERSLSMISHMYRDNRHVKRDIDR